MSYLVEQPPHCDLLRLSLSTGRFVRYRRTRLPQRVDTASSLRFFSFHACLSRPLRVRGRTRGAFFSSSPSIPGPRPHVVGGSSYHSLKCGDFFFKIFPSPSFPGPRPRGNTRGSMAGVTITLLKVSSFSKLFLKFFPSPTFPGPRPHGNTRGSSYHPLKSDHVPCVSRTSASRARVNGGSNYHSLKSDKFLEIFSKSHVSRTSASR